MGPFSPYKYLYGLVLAVAVVVSATTAVDMLSDFQAGTALESDRIARFLTSACQIPLWMYFLHQSRSRPAGLLETVNGRVFERSATDIAMWAIATWGFGISMLVGGFLSTQNAEGPKSADQWFLWFGAALCVLSLCGIVFSFTGIWMHRLVLSKDGILFSKVKAGLIHWQDVSDIRFERKLGYRRIAVDVVDPKKYGMKRPHLIISPAYFNAGPDAMMEIFEQERTLTLKPL